MMNQAVARRYGRALFELAQEKGQIDQIGQDLQMVVATIKSEGYLRGVMNDVLVSPAVKQNLVEKLFSGKVSSLVLNFLLVVVKKRREVMISEMYQVYQDLANEALGIVEVEVRSAIELPEQTYQKLEGKLVAHLGKRVKFKTQVAPELIGGLVVRVGDTLMDGSVKSRLRRMHARLIRSQAE